MMKNSCFAFLVVFTSVIASGSSEAQSLLPSLNRLPSLPVVSRLVPSSPRLLETPILPARRSSDWYPYVIARESDRDWIRQTPIELRPNRPLHFWGNSRRWLAR